MRVLIAVFVITMTPAFANAESMKNILNIEKIGASFINEMDSGKNKPSDVTRFIEELEKTLKGSEKENGLDIFISTVRIVDYSTFDKRKCYDYKRTIIVKSANPSVELSPDNIDTYTYYGLKILSKVCNDPGIMEIQSSQ